MILFAARSRKKSEPPSFGAARRRRRASRGASGAGICVMGGSDCRRFRDVEKASWPVGCAGTAAPLADFGCRTSDFGQRASAGVHFFWPMGLARPRRPKSSASRSQEPLRRAA
eukprot:2172483-Alexandrium_andersonii.AAC.1